MLRLISVGPYFIQTSKKNEEKQAKIFAKNYVIGYLDIENNIFG